jgi:hypothetical protein
MDKEMASKKKKVTLANFSDERRSVGKEALINRQKNVINDGLTSQERRAKRLKEAAKDCWWVEQYIMGNLNAKNNKRGIDDE